MINKLATIMVLQIWEITFATTFSSICWNGWQSPFHVSTISKSCKKKIMAKFVSLDLIILFMWQFIHFHAKGIYEWKKEKFI